MAGPEIIDLPSFLEPRAEILAVQKELKGMDQSDPNVQQALADIRVTLKRNAELEKASMENSEDFAQARHGKGSSRGGQFRGKGGSEKMTSSEVRVLSEQIGEEIVSRGLETNTEHIMMFDKGSSKVWEGTSNNKTSVSFDFGSVPSGSKLIVHHNHPSDRSLSSGDLKVLSSNPKIKTLYADGHDGSVYWAEATQPSRTLLAHLKIKNKVSKKIKGGVDEGVITAKEGDTFFRHIVNVALSKTTDDRGKVPFKYGFKLSNQKASLFNNHKTFFDKIIDGTVEEVSNV